MPVWKYRRIEDMPEAWEMNAHVPVAQRMRSMRRFFGTLPGPLGIPRGVQKFRSSEELWADRERYEDARIARLNRR